MISTQSTSINSIQKEDMITIKIPINYKDMLWEILWRCDWREMYGIIKYSVKNNEIFLSCVSSMSRDLLFNLLVYKLEENSFTSSTQ